MGWIIKLFGKHLGETKIHKGSLKGVYDVYRFLGKVYEIEKESN